MSHTAAGRARNGDIGVRVMEDEPSIPRCVVTTIDVEQTLRLRWSANVRRAPRPILRSPSITCSSADRSRAVHKPSLTGRCEELLFECQRGGAVLVVIVISFSTFSGITNFGAPSVARSRKASVFGLPPRSALG